MSVESAEQRSPYRMTQRGKGKVINRRAVNKDADTRRLAATPYYEDPALSRYPARFDNRLVHGSVKSLNVGSSAQDINAAFKLISENQPTVMCGSPVAKELVKSNWGFDDLTEDHLISGNPKEQEIEVFCSEARHHRFLECDMSKNIDAGPYFIREPETQLLKLSPRSFVKCSREWKSRKLMIKAEVMKMSKMTVSSDPDGQPTSFDSENIVEPISGPLQEVAKKIHSGINWSWIQDILKFQGFGAVMSVQLEAGVAGGLQPAKYCRRDQILVQITGCRRILLINPRWAFEGMYPFPCAHPYDKYSMVDLESLDCEAWPEVDRVQGMVAILHPGDILYIPEYWFAHIQDVKDENVALRFELHRGSRPPSKDGAFLRLSRALEERVMAVEGMARVRYWLQLISTGREWKVLDLGTVQGYRRACMAQDIRDDIEQTLGTGKWSEMLSVMCAGRLEPTPWLNAHFREPLLLTDKPVIYEDDRTEEEKKYPQLFRRKLEAQGWKVQ